MITIKKQPDPRQKFDLTCKGCGAEYEYEREDTREAADASGMVVACPICDCEGNHYEHNRVRPLQARPLGLLSAIAVDEAS